MNLFSTIWGRIIAGLFLLIILVNLDLHSIAAESPEKINPQDSLKILDTLVRKFRINDPDLAYHYSRSSLKIANRLKDPESMIQAYMTTGMALLASQKDSSYFYYNKALPLANTPKLLGYKMRIMYDIAGILWEAESYQNAILMLDSCIRIAEDAEEYEILTDAYNVLANIKISLRDTVSAIELYNKAFSIAKNNFLYRQMGNALSNLANHQKDFKISIAMQKEAVVYLKRSDFLKKSVGTEEEIAGIYINIANRLTNPDSALSYYNKALDLAKKANLSQISVGALNNMAYSYLDRNEPDRAEKCILEAIPLAEKLKSSDWLSELYDSYADILTIKGDFKKAAIVQKNALIARIDADRKQASNQLRLLSVLLDVKSKEFTIQAKEKQILVQRNRLRNMQLILAVAALAIIVFVFFYLWSRQKFRMKLQSEKINSARRIIEIEENEKGKTARELHDITGQLVMGITGEIENIEFPNTQSKEMLQGRIKDLGKSIRLISHRMNRAMMEHFSFEELIEGQCNDVQKLTGIPIHVKIPEIPLTLPPEVILHTYRMVQELLTNASKYVKGHQVWIRINHVSNGFILSYKDDGPGFETEKVTKSGMGLSNIFERAKLLGGQAVVTSSPEKGTSWEISVPLLKQN